MLNEDTVEWVKVEFPVESDIEPQPETDIPVETELIEPQPETDLTLGDTLEMLKNLGVDTDD